MSKKKLFTILKGQSIWLELKATEDTDLIDCEQVCKIHFTDKGIDNLSSEQILLKGDVISAAKNQLMEELTEMLLEKGFLDKSWLINKYCNGGGF